MRLPVQGPLHLCPPSTRPWRGGPRLGEGRTGEPPTDSGKVFSGVGLGRHTEETSVSRDTPRASRGVPQEVGVAAVAWEASASGPGMQRGAAPRRAAGTHAGRCSELLSGCRALSLLPQGPKGWAREPRARGEKAGTQRGPPSGARRRSLDRALCSPQTEGPEEPG